MHQSALILSLLALPALAAGGAAPEPVGALVGPAQLSDSTAALTRALESVRAENLSADVHFIASDELGGRDTPSEGLRVAARYIRARLQRLGVQPGAPDGYFYTYPLELQQLDAAATGVVIEGRGARRELAFGSDYFPRLRRIEDSSLSGPVTYVGDADEVEGFDLKGRWALTLEGARSLRRRTRALMGAGAIGVIVIPGPDYDGKPYAERFASTVARALHASPSYPSQRSAEREDSEFATLYLRPAAGAGLVPEGCVPGSDLGLTLTHTTRCAGEGDGRVQVENVCGFWPGNDPVLRDEVIILSAHYDHVGKRDDGRIFNGADDNASGTSGLLAVAEALRTYGPLRRSVFLMWVSGEEKGLWGSQAWTEAPWLPEGTHAICDINIDMIGRNAPNELLITPTAEHEAFNGLSRMFMKFSPEEGFPALGSADEYWNRSDHRNFYVNLKIPVAFLFSDVHEDYHQETDTADKIDYEKMRRVVRLVVRTLDALQTDELHL